MLERLDIFRYLPDYASWPTFPQVYVKGELIGGCDIVVSQTESGALLQQFKELNIETA